MTKVKILVTAPYWEDRPRGKVGARVYQAGEMVEFPAAYAAFIIAQGLAEPVTADAPVTEAPPAEPAPRRKGRRRE
jgi:hypothetical protein